MCLVSQRPNGGGKDGAGQFYAFQGASCATFHALLASAIKLVIDEHLKRTNPFFANPIWPLRTRAERSRSIRISKFTWGPHGTPPPQTPSSYGSLPTVDSWWSIILSDNADLNHFWRWGWGGPVWSLPEAIYVPVALVRRESYSGISTQFSQIVNICENPRTN